MSKARTYIVSDLFYTDWNQLTPLQHIEVFALQQQLNLLDTGSVAYGLHLIKILRCIRKNKRLVGKINEAQAVDIFNDLKFLRDPWLYFPIKKFSTGLHAPEEKMATHTFDHFIYADNEFTSYLATQDRKYLARLAVTLYRAKGEVIFDKECVDERAAKLRKIKPWQEDLVFCSYAQIRNFITKRCKTLLPTSPRPSPGGEGDKVEKAVPTGGMWLKLKHRLAETAAFQGYDNAGRANMYSALDYLEDLAQLKEKK